MNEKLNKEIRDRIKREGYHIRVMTTLGTAVKISKKEAIRLMNELSRRRIVPKVDFTEIRTDQYVVVIDASK